MKEQKCKITMKEEEGKVIMRMKGKCNPQKPKEEINQKFEFEIPDYE